MVASVLAAGGLHDDGGPLAQYLNAGMVNAGHPPPFLPPAPAPAPTLPIDQDSLCFKIISCIPLIGPVVSWYQQSSIMDSINHEINSQHIGNNKITVVPHIISLLEVKNHYVKADVTSGLIVIAAAVFFLAIGMLGILGIVCGIGVVLLTARRAYVLYKNTQALNALNALPPAGGFPVGFQVEIK